MGKMMSRKRAIRIVSGSMDKMFGPFDNVKGIDKERSDSNG